MSARRNFSTGVLTMMLGLLAMSLVGGATAGTAAKAANPVAGDFSVALPGFGQDMEIDEARDRLYVSVPSTNEVVVVSLSTFQIIDSLFIGQAPEGIDLSDDGSTLYAALNASGSVAYLDIDTEAVTTVDVGSLLGDPRTWDVIEGQPNRVYVSANPGSSAFAWIVQIKTDQGNSASRVASDRIIRCAPVFEDSPDDHFLYVGECFSPESLYKLDLSQDTAPIILEDQHGSISGASHLDVSPDGTQIYLRSGQVLRTSSFTQAGLITGGPSQVSEDGTIAYAAAPPNSLAAHDTSTFLQVDTIPLPECSYDSADALRLLPGGGGFLVLDDDVVCGISEVIAASAFLSPPSGRYLSTQAFDVAVVTEAGGLNIHEISLTANGIDVTQKFLDCAIQGMTDSGGRTLRCADMNFSGSSVLELTVTLEDGRILTDTASYEVIRTRERP